TATERQQPAQLRRTAACPTPSGMGARGRRTAWRGANDRVVVARSLRYVNLRVRGACVGAALLGPWRCRTMEVIMDESLKQKIVSLLAKHRIMTVATLRPDGWPQATTVGYTNDGLTLYFLCGRGSQKAANLTLDDRVSLTVDHDADQVMEISGLSMAGRAQRV